MTDHLPDDVNRWPRNPHALLKVARNVDRKQLRRAYNQLIRKYKPEHAPAEFRLIRDAYESILQSIEWSERLGGTVDVFESPPELQLIESPAEDAAEQSSADTAVPVPLESRRTESAGSRASLSDDVDAAWQLAAEGDLIAGYRKLAETFERSGGSEEILVRLYWLLKLQPSVDLNRSPVDWLLEGFRRRGLSGRPLELFRGEVEQWPLLALSPKCAALLDAGQDPHRVFELVEWRIRAAAQAKRWQEFRDDLKSIERLFSFDHQDLYARALMRASCELAWSSDPGAIQLRQQIAEKLASLEQLNTAIAYEFDHLDLMHELTESWRWLRTRTLAPAELLILIRRSASGRNEERLADLPGILEKWSQDVNRALESLDRLYGAAPLVVQRIWQIIEEYRANSRWQYQYDETGETQQVIGRFFQLRKLQNYESLRLGLMQLCLQEWIPLEDVVRYASQRQFATSDWAYEVCELLGRDAPLHCVVHGLQAFAS